MEHINNLLEELTNAYGPSGFEGPIRTIVRRKLSPICDQMETDGIGSIIGRLRGNQDSPRIMLAAHMDELGLMVKYITPEGFIKFQTIGGWLDQSLINQRWMILTRNGPVQGVSGIKTIHVMTPEAQNQIFRRDQIFIDVGAKNKQEAEEHLGIRPGDPIAPDSRFISLNGDDIYLAKAWDDRVGVAIIIEVIRKLKAALPPNTIYGVGTVQEEVGLRGARTSSYKIHPDIGINLESGVAGDYPGIGPDEAQERLGGGPSIYLHDSSMLPNLKLRDFVLDVAKDKNIPVQFNVAIGYGEDGAEIQRTHDGTPAINIAVPVRYLHSHNGLININDFHQTIELVAAIIQQLDYDTVQQLKNFE